MKFELHDHTAGITMIKVESPNTQFVMNVFNLFMLEMLELHGTAFKKLSSEDKGDGTIHLIYTHNITGTLQP